MITIREQRGVALLEFALLAPILFAIVWGGIELARAIRVTERLTGLSREVGNAAFRECSPGLTGNSQQCLEGIAAQFAPLIGPGMDDVIVIASVYWVNPENNAVELAGSARVFTEATDPDPASQTAYCLTGTCRRPISDSFVRDAGLIAIGEVYGEFVPVVGHIPGNLWFDPGHLYEATIY